MKFRSINPATGTTVWEGVAASPEEVDQAVQTASAAFGRWRDVPLSERLQVVEQFRTRLEIRKEEIALAISNEMGKPYWESLQEVSAMIAKVAISIAAYEERTGVHHKVVDGVSLTVHHRPLGVIAVFAPYNFPGHLPNGQMVPALIAGNTVVLKPSELTPHVGKLLHACWVEAGLASGEVVLVQGGADTGAAMAAHPGINGLLFTGSVQTGQLLAKQFGDHPDKLLALEMGGNNPLVVDRPSNLQAALYCAIQSAYATSGQRCTCARRLILPRSPENERFVEQFAQAIERIHVGPHTDRPEPFMGPLVSKAVADRLMQWQDDLLMRGAQPIVQARRLDGAFLSPGLIDVTGIAQGDEEHFGPILQLIWVDSFEEAIVEANRTRFGLAAALLSDDEEQWRLFYRRVKAGVINWNRPTTGASSMAPFGGVGLSGNFRPAGSYMCDSCAYPVASMSSEQLLLPQTLPPGLHL